MLFYYIRHGDPIYSPDSLTPLGKRQAEALGKRLSLYGIDKIYSSTSNRAYETAIPTSEILGKPITQLDFANEGHVWNEFTAKLPDGNYTWFFSHDRIRRLFTEKEITDLGFNWFEHPEFKEGKCKNGVERVYKECDKFFAALGYEHERYTGRYKVTKPTEERVALFAHQGFGLAFLSCLLDIPYPTYCTRFDLCHSGMTVISFNEENGYAIPRVLTHSSDSHIYREGLPTNYNHWCKF